MATRTKKEVDLGFVEDIEPCYLESHYFPSKIGGKPAWLSLENLPSGDNILCRNCRKPCAFLLQIYAPIDDNVTCFHRTLFVLMCKDPDCCKRHESNSFKVYRSQLPKENKYYSTQPPSKVYDRSKEHPHAGRYQDLCVVCGCAGGKRCSKCHKATYCSKEHQTADWKAGHKAVCGGAGNHGDDPEVAVQSCCKDFLFPEFELITEAEESDDDKDDTATADTEKSEAQKMKEYEEVLNKCTGLIKETGEEVDNDLHAMARHETQGDKIFSKFKKRIAKDPDQVLRYERLGEVLWVSDEALPGETDIPDCPRCKAPRRFEFQILPQLLNHLKLDQLGASVDWGTLVIYTCENSCDLDNNYTEEVIWKQDFSLAKK